MGTWGYEIFEDDIALDLRGDFEAALAEGLSVPDATARVLAEYGDAVEDFDDGPIIAVALAALQLEHGALQPEVRERALAVIDNSKGMHGWEEGGAEHAAKRRAVLAALRARLVGTGA